MTGQGHRDSLHQFMLKHCDSEGQNNVTANRDAVEEHRPEAVVVEVGGLRERDKERDRQTGKKRKTETETDRQRKRERETDNERE